MNGATEAEDYQAVGIKCRDALIAVAKDHADSKWVGDIAERPKAADFKGWANIFADRLTEGRMAVGYDTPFGRGCARSGSTTLACPTRHLKRSDRRRSGVVAPLLAVVGR
jgi:hypothetical protein